MATKMWKQVPLAFKAGLPLCMIGPVGYWYYDKRNKLLRSPVMQRTLQFLYKDQNVIDFCGENVKPTWRIQINEDPQENYAKYEFSIKGTGGTLGISVVGDYLTHKELSILEEERVDFMTQ